MKTFITATPAKKLLVPGYNYFPMLQNFISKQFDVGEKYSEFLHSHCVYSLEQCSKVKFIGPKCHKILEPMPNNSANSYYYLPASKTPQKMNYNKR